MTTFAESMAAIEELVGALEALGRGSATEQARALVAAVLDVHRHGLARILELAGEAGRTLRQDEAVAALLALHGLDEPPPASFVPVERLRARPAAERCEGCGAGLDAAHEHLLDVDTRALSCACAACVVTASGTRVRVPRRVERLPDLRLDDAEWASLEVPVGLAFLYRGGAGEAMAGYPGPAGATRAQLPALAWSRLTDVHPVFGELLPEVEALLVNRAAPSDTYRVSIDECYRLVGTVRAAWRGLSGGTEAQGAIARFFGELAERDGHG